MDYNKIADVGTVRIRQYYRGTVPRQYHDSIPTV